MLGDNIRRVLNAKRMTSKELAEMLGVTPTYISYLLTNKRTPSYEMLNGIAETLGVSVERLTGESVSSIIDERLEERGMTLKEVADKAGVPLSWLQNIDSCTPGEIEDLIDKVGRPLDWDDMIGDTLNYQSYQWITKVAEVLDLPGGNLRAALARQETPIYDSPRDSAETDFAEPDNSAKIRTIAAHLDGKDLTPQKMKLLEQYINTLFDEDK